MDSGTMIELGREAIALTLTLGFPVLLAAIVMGFLVGLFQALTQIQEQTLAFVPKIIVVLLVLSLTLPWMMTTMVEYTTQLIENIPEVLSR
ncbi:MAG: flagellar biosynthesis protein FliQ [Planctomycetia bacterium]|nr:flagellar biosynthesis protein FliQ [Planctomycetia bacterium]